MEVHVVEFNCVCLYANLRGNEIIRETPPQFPSGRKSRLLLTQKKKKRDFDFTIYLI